MDRAGARHQHDPGQVRQLLHQTRRLADRGSTAGFDPDLFDALPLPALLCDGTGRIRFANRAALALAGALESSGNAWRSEADISLGVLFEAIVAPSGGKLEIAGLDSEELTMVPGDPGAMAKLARALAASGGRHALHLGDGRSFALALSGPRLAPTKRSGGQGQGGRPDGLGECRYWIVQLGEASAAARCVRRREAMLRDLAHDLRSPLVSIRTLLEGVEAGGVVVPDCSGYGVCTSPAGEQSFSEWRSQLTDLTERALCLADGFMQLARAEERPLKIEPLCARLLLEDAVEEVRPQACSANIAITLVGAERPALVGGDHELLGRCLANIVGNAIRHGSAGRRIECGIAETVEQGRAWIELWVRDWGSGVPAELRKAIFASFVQGRCAGERVRPDRASSGEPVLGAVSGLSGAGLGLAFVGTVMARHGGKVSCEGPVGGGALFRVALPVLAAASEVADDVDHH